MRKHIIIEEIEGALVVSILKDGYNIIDRTIYDPELARKILNDIEEASKQ